jgi:hypothetical protein
MHYALDTKEFTVNFNVTADDQGAQIKTAISRHSKAEEEAVESSVETAISFGSSETLIIKYDGDIALEMILEVKKADANQCVIEPVAVTTNEAPAC